LELGDFEETVGRVNQEDLDTSRGSRSTNFSYKVTAKVPVDTVGVHRYPLDLNRPHDFQAVAAGSRSRSLGWIIVRVALSQGIKLVSIESPLALKNVSDVDVLCEVRDHGGLSLIWRCIVAKNRHDENGVSISVPADIVPSLQGRSRTFGASALPKDCKVDHEADVPSTDTEVATRITLPPPFSPSSIAKGMIDEKNVNLHVVLFPPRKFSLFVDRDERPVIPLNLCALRIGSSDELVGAIPEQRVLVFRSSLAIQNRLALPVQVQVRIKAESSGFGSPFEWVDLGVLNCAAHTLWAGTMPADTAEIRVRVTGHSGEPSRQFPFWSSPVTIPAEQFANDSTIAPSLAKLKVFDSSDIPLLISIDVSKGTLPPEKILSQDDIKDLSTKLPIASRIISLFCPFWIVDGSGLDLQYQSRAFIAGQTEAALDPPVNRKSEDGSTTFSLGLGELLDDRDFIYLPSRISFQVLMIGEEGSTRLFARRRLTREETSRDSLSSWSDPISLTMENLAYCDFSVPPPPKILTAGAKILGASDVEDPFALRARLVRAPEALGGLHGTRLIHIICRYAVVNELGQEIEIRDSSTRLAPISVPADGRPRPLHFDDSGPLRFRPKEYGWVWSGRFNVKRHRHELTIRVKHGLKGHTKIFSVEFHAKTESGTCVLVFRPATHAPYRIDNHCTFPAVLGVSACRNQPPLFSHIIVFVSQLCSLFNIGKSLNWESDFLRGKMIGLC